MKFTAKQVRKIQQIAYETDVTSLNALLNTGESEADTEVGDLVIDPKNPFEDIENDERREFLSHLISQLKDPRQQRVLMLRFGLDGSGEYRTLEEVGERYGVTRERIRQIEMKGLAKLRKIMLKNNIKREDF